MFRRQNKAGCSTDDYREPLVPQQSYQYDENATSETVSTEDRKRKKVKTWFRPTTWFAKPERISSDADTQPRIVKLLRGNKNVQTKKPKEKLHILEQKKTDCSVDSLENNHEILKYDIKFKFPGDDSHYDQLPKKRFRVSSNLGEKEKIKHWNVLSSSNSLPKNYKYVGGVTHEDSNILKNQRRVNKLNPKGEVVIENQPDKEKQQLEKQSEHFSNVFNAYKQVLVCPNEHCVTLHETKYSNRRLQNLSSEVTRNEIKIYNTLEDCSDDFIIVNNQPYSSDIFYLSTKPDALAPSHPVHYCTSVHMSNSVKCMILHPPLNQKGQRYERFV